MELLFPFQHKKQALGLGLTENMLWKIESNMIGNIQQQFHVLKQLIT